MKIGVVRRNLPRWPWLVGLAIAGLLAYTIMDLIDARKVRAVALDPQSPAAAAALGTEPAAPARPVAVQPPSSSLDALLPIGLEDLGQRVSVSGRVTGETSVHGYWILSDENTLMFVRGAPAAKKGARQENIVGILTPLSAKEASGWPGPPDTRENPDGWTAVEGMYLKVGTGVPPDTSARDKKAAAAPRRKG
jgi:hypothetical protein